MREIDLARQDVEKINKTFRERKECQGQHYQKADFRKTFELPVCRSTIVWALLREQGYLMNRYSIQVPKFEKEQQEQAANSKKNVVSDNTQAN